MKPALAAALAAAALLTACNHDNDLRCPPGSVADNNQCHVTVAPSKETTGESTTTVPSTSTVTTETVVPSTSEITTTATVPGTP